VTPNPKTARDQLSPREIAERVGLSYHAVLRAIKRGDLAAFEVVPGRLRVEMSEYERWRTARPACAEAVRPEPRRRERARNQATGAASFDRLTAIEGGTA
jgi:hypothetical protein